MSDNPQEASGPNRQPLLPGEADPDAVFAQCLRVAREAAGLTQQQLADRMAGAGYPMRQNTISTIEAGTRKAWLGEAVALADIVGVSLADMLIEPPIPGELSAAVVERAALYRRRNMARSQVQASQADLERAHHVLAEIEADLGRAERKVQSLMRLNGEVSE